MHAMFMLQFTWEFVRARWLAFALVAIFAGILGQYTLKLHHTEHTNRSTFLR